VEKLDKEQVRRMKRMRRAIFRSALTLAIATLFGITMTASLASVASGQTTAGTNSAHTASGYTPKATGELDCNGFSPAQKEVRASECTDIRGIQGVDNSNTWGGKFYDNGVYIGHDEPDTTFLSSAPGSGNNVSWNLNIGRDPAALPTDVSPGHDISHWFPRALVLDGAVRPELLPADPVHARVRLERAQLLRINVHNRAERRRLDVHGDAALPAGQPPVRRQRELRRHALVRRADHRQPGVHHGLRDM
jgi:hypothetical protein